MDNFQNLDIFDFLASVGKHAVTKATQGFLKSRPKQSKGSDIVFVEDTDEYANLSNPCSFNGRENKGTCFSGEWKSRDNPYRSGAKKTETSYKWKSNTQTKSNCGWGVQKDDTQYGGWETGTWNEMNSGMGEQNDGGWDQDIQAKCDDGWGEEKKDAAWGWGQGTNREATFDTGWGKEEECCKGMKGTENAGTHIGQQSNMQEDDKGWGSSSQEEHKGWGNSLHKEDDGGGWGEETDLSCSEGAKKKGVSACGGWERGTQVEGPQRNSTRQEYNGGWGENNSDPGKWGKGAQEKGTQSGWGSSMRQGSDSRWGEAKSSTGGWGKKVEVSASSGWKSVHQEEGTQKVQGSSIDQGHNGGWGDDESASGGWERGTLEESTGKGWESSIIEENDGGWGNSIHEEKEGGWGEDTSVADVWRKEKKVSAPGGWESRVLEEGTQNGQGGHVPQENNGRVPQENNGGWGEDKSAPGGWGRAVQEEATKGAWESSTKDGCGSSVPKKRSGGWGKDNSTTPAGCDRGTQHEGTQNGWGSRLCEVSNVGWGEDEIAAGGWRKTTAVSASCDWESNTHEEGIRNGWGSSAHQKGEEKGVSGGWRKHTRTNDTYMRPQGSMPRKANAGWENKRNISADGWTEKGKAASGGWGEGTWKEGNSWGADKKFAAGEWGGKKKYDPGRWRNDTLKERASSGCRGSAQDAGSAGWGKRTEGGWGHSTKQEVGDGWGSSMERKAESGEGKDSTCCGWGEGRGVSGGRGKDAPKENVDGWGEKQGVAAGGGWETGAQEEVDDGWGSSIEKKNDSGWGEETKINDGSSRAVEETNEWGNAKEGVAAGWEQTTHKEVDDGWGQSIQKEVDLGWGQAKDGTDGGWKEERDHTACGWGGEKGAWSKGTQDATLGWENKVNTEKGTQKENGWESRTQKDTNAGWGEATTTAGTTGGWGQSSHQGGDDGWEEFTKVNNTTSDTSGRNRKAANGWEPTTQGDHTRRSGTFGPSGSNTVPLGKRKGISRGSETNDWTQPTRDNGAADQLNSPGAHQDGRQRWGKRFINGNAFRDPASSCSNNQNRRPHLRALISLPEYSQMDELYKATNRILHHSGYQPGDRLNPDDERFVLDEILAHHREKESKLGCGMDYIMIDSHADHQVSCFWVVRTDGSRIDFSYWKCLEHLFEVKYPHAVREVSGEEDNDGSVVALVESVKAKESDSREEGIAPLARVEAEEKVMREEENDGW